MRHSPTKGRDRRLNEKSNVALSSQVVACCGGDGGRLCLIFGGCALLLFLYIGVTRFAASVYAASQCDRERRYIYSTRLSSLVYSWRAEFHASRHAQRIIQVQAANSAVQNWRSLNAQRMFIFSLFILALKWSERLKRLPIFAKELRVSLWHRDNPLWSAEPFMCDDLFQKWRKKPYRLFFFINNWKWITIFLVYLRIVRKTDRTKKPAEKSNV